MYNTLMSSVLCTSYIIATFCCRMRAYLAILLLSLAVLNLFLAADAASAAVRRGPPAPRGRLPSPAKAAQAPRRGRVTPRRGRQEEAAADTAAADAEGSGDDIPTWCNPKDPMGAWLLFKGVKLNCVGKGFTDFGPYGGPPAADEEETAETSANAV